MIGQQPSDAWLTAILDRVTTHIRFDHVWCVRGRDEGSGPRQARDRASERDRRTLQRIQTSEQVGA